MSKYKFKPFKTGKKMRKHQENLKNMNERIKGFRSLSFFGKLIHLLKYNKI